MSVNHRFVYFALTLLQLFGLAIYRVTLHPLAKYPGPFLAKITILYDTYHSYAKDRHADQYECQKKYGNVFRYGPNYLIINTPGGLKDIYTNAKTNPIQKGSQYKFLFDYGNVSTHSAIDRNVHAFKRRVLSYAFSESALRNLEPTMIKTIDRWMTALGADASDETKGWSKAKNMAHWANYVTFDVLGDLCFGKPFGMIESDDLRSVTDLLLIRAGLLLVVCFVSLSAQAPN